MRRMGGVTVTMWAPAYKRFERDSRLVNSRKGFGVLPTWPAQTYPFATPIDHCLHSADIWVTDCRVGSRIGSDHMPLLVDFVVECAGAGPQKGPRQVSGLSPLCRFSCDARAECVCWCAHGEKERPIPVS